MPVATGFFGQVSDANAPVQAVPQIIDPSGGARINYRPLDYVGAGSTTYGHYIATSFSGAVNTISAAGILASLRWADASRLLVLTGLYANVEVLSAITTAAVIDLQAFVFRGCTGNAVGSGSSTLTLSGNNQKCRANMGTTLFASGGEIRTIGTTTALTAATGKTNDAAPFGAAFFGTLFNTSSTGVAVLVKPGAAITPGGWVPLFEVNNGYKCPIVLASGEGIEVQVITATPTDGTLKYAFRWEWAECATF